MTEITEAVEALTALVGEPAAHWSISGEPGDECVDVQVADLSALLSELTRLQEENGQLRLAICGGEDAPGYADSLPLADILGVAANNLGSWREASDRAARLQEEVKGLRKVTPERVEAVALAIGEADDRAGFRSELTRLVDGAHTYTLTMLGEAQEFSDLDDLYETVRQNKNRVRAEAVITALVTLQGQQS